MDDIALKELEKLRKRRKAQLDRQNKHIKENYKQQSITIKKDIYNKLVEVYKGSSLEDGRKWSMNGYINALIKADLERIENEKNSSAGSGPVDAALPEDEDLPEWLLVDTSDV